MRLLKRSKNISSEKFNRAYRFYNDILEIDIKRVTKIKIIDTILRDYLNFIKKLFNVLIR